MRNIAFVFISFLAACSSDANHLGNPLLLPLSGLSNAIGNAAYNETRGKVELFVKTNHPALMRDIKNGGGATLERVFDIANVPKAIRAEHTLQLQSDRQIYSANLEALIVAIMVVSG